MPTSRDTILTERRNLKSALTVALIMACFVATASAQLSGDPQQPQAAHSAVEIELQQPSSERLSSEEPAVQRTARAHPARATRTPSTRAVPNRPKPHRPLRPDPAPRPQVQRPQARPQPERYEPGQTYINNGTLQSGPQAVPAKALSGDSALPD